MDPCCRPELNLSGFMYPDICCPKPVRPVLTHCRRSACNPPMFYDGVSRRVMPESLYVSELDVLYTYESPPTEYTLITATNAPYVAPPGVNWNQMSDRAQPHLQTAVVASGGGYHASSTRHSITRLRPGALGPGGLGVDIKHNSYNRYLNRLKGRCYNKCGAVKR